MASEKVREIGLFERYHVHRHGVKFDTCINLTARYNNPVNKTNLVPALEKVAQSHGALCVRIEGEATEQPTFHRLNVLDFTKIVRFAQDKNWGTLNEVLESELSQPFDTSSQLPLWRLVVLGDNTIVFSVHHAIADGLSTVAFHRALLAALKDTDSSAAPSISEPMIVPPFDKLKLELPVEQATNISPSLLTIAGTLFGMLAPSWMKPAIPWTGNVVNLDADPLLLTRVKILEFSSSYITSLNRLCKEHITSVTAVLHILAVTSISHALLEDTQSSKFKTISTSIPMSLRGYCNVSADVFCDFVSAYNETFTLDANKSPAQIWVDAMKLTSNIRSTDNRGTLGLLKFVSNNYNEYFTSQVGKNRDPGLELSNVGRANISTLVDVEGAWRIDKMVFAQANPIVGPALKMNVIGNPDDSLIVTVTWSEGAVSTATAERFINRFQAEMDILLKSSS